MREALLSEVIQESRAGFWGTEPGSGDLDVRVVRNGDIQDNCLRWQSLPLRSVSHSEAARASLRKDDILITTSGDCGYTAHVQSDPAQPTIASNFIRILRVDSARVVSRFLYHLLRSSAFRASLGPYIRGTALKNLSFTTAAEHIKVPLPAPDEQRRIAEILDKAEALRAKRLDALAILDTLAQVIFIDMFGDPVANPKGWHDPKLAELVANMQYGPRFYNEPYTADGIRIARITDLNDAGELAFDAMPRMRVSDHDVEQFAMRPGDLIFARSGATVGKVALFAASDPPCIPGAYFIRMRFKESVVPEYAKGVLAAKSIRELVVMQSRQSAQQNFSGPSLRRLPMPLPPMTLQAQFARRVAAIGRQKQSQRRGLVGLDSLFASLQHRAFRGDLSPCVARSSAWGPRSGESFGFR